MPIPSMRPSRQGNEQDAPRRERDARRIEKLEREVARLREDRDRWKHRSKRIQEQLDAARRAGCRQAAPFAKNRPQGRGGRPEGRWNLWPRCARRCAASTSKSATARTVDGACRAGIGCRPQTHSARPEWKRVPVSPPWWCRCTSRWAVPLAKLAKLLQTTFGLAVTPGGLMHLLHRVARDATPLYALLREQVRNSPVVVPDEIGWRVGAVRQRLWVFATPETTL